MNHIHSRLGYSTTPTSHIEIEEDRRHRRQERSRSLSRMRLLGFFSLFSLIELLDSFLRRYVSPKPSRRSRFLQPSLFASGSHPKVFSFSITQSPIGTSLAAKICPTSGWWALHLPILPLFSAPKLKEFPNLSSSPFWEAPFFDLTFSGTSNKRWFCKSPPLYNRSRSRPGHMARNLSSLAFSRS